MFWLGLLLPVVFVPGYIGASIPTQWALLSIFLPLTLWSGSLTHGHKVFLVFLAYALATGFWTLNIFSWVLGIWHAVLWFLCFHVGTLARDLRPLWKGLAIGLSASTIVAIFQHFGFSPVEATPSGTRYAAGLFFNPALTSLICGMALVACICHRLWLYIPAPALGLFLSGSRGGIAALGLGLGARFGGWLGASAALVIGVVGFSFSTSPSDTERLQIWSVAVRTLSWIGHGAGSFADLWYISQPGPRFVRPEYVHNEPLQLLFEYGPGASALLFLFGMALRKSTDPNWPILFALCGSGLYFFPLHAPVLMACLLMCTGHALRSWGSNGTLSHDSRPNLLSWLANEQFPASVLGR